jgi:hypothetical protein
MCTSSVHTPAPQPVKAKDPVYMRNLYLDGLGIGAENAGRNSLRIDPGSPAPNTSAPFLGIAPNPHANPRHNGARTYYASAGVNTGLGIAS